MSQLANPPNDPWGEIHRLATLRTCGSMTETDIEQLEELLSSDAKARRLYVAHVFETTALAMLLQEVPSGIDTILSETEKTPEAGRTPACGFLGEAFHSIQITTVLAFGLAILLTVGTLAWLGMLHFPESSRVRPTRVASSDGATHPPSSRMQQVATLTGTVDCRWASDLASPDYGEPIHAGRMLDLHEGLAQLTFESGAKLILQGPVKFTTETAMRGTLDRGKLTALVPLQAFGFTVRTPTTEIVDMGTEFGLSVDADGQTEVDVFQGEVVTWSIDREGQTVGDGLRLIEKQSVMYDGAIDSPPIEPADSNKFIREIAPRLTEDQLPPLLIRHRLALWLAADTLVDIDENHRVVCWQDILAGDNQTEESVWQHDSLNRPLLIDAAIDGKPALHFDGRTSFMVTTPLATTDDQTLFFVFQRGQEPSGNGLQRTLINYNGPPINLAENLEANSFRILQIDGKDGPGIYRGFVYSSVRPKWAACYGLVRSQTPAQVGKPTILAYTFNTKRDQAELFINGQSQGRAKAPPGFGITSRKIIGKHPLQNVYFEGDIAEILIFNDGLRSKAITNVTRYLATKYHVTLGP